MERYRAILQAGRDAGLSIWVCLHHFTLPGWFADDLNGFRDDRQGRLLWSRHVDWVGETFGDLVAGWKPINEPTFYAIGGHLLGAIPPGSPRSARGRPRARHDAPGRRRRRPAPPHAGHADGDGREPARRCSRWRTPRRARPPSPRWRAIWWDSWASDEQLDHYDYLGFSYYSALGVHGDGSFGPWPVDGTPGPQGYVRWAEGFAHVLDRLSADHPDRPILISEAGIGTDDDQQRNDYVEAVLDIARDAITGGVDLRGIFWWTGVDNYEWGQGFDVRFGLFDRDRNPKPAAEIAAAAAAQLTTAQPLSRARRVAERDRGPERRGYALAVGGPGADGVLVEALAQVEALEEQLDRRRDRRGRLVAAGEVGDRLAQRGLLLEQRRRTRRT